MAAPIPVNPNFRRNHPDHEINRAAAQVLVPIAPTYIAGVPVSMVDGWRYASPRWLPKALGIGAIVLTVLVCKSMVVDTGRRLNTGAGAIASAVTEHTEAASQSTVVGIAPVAVTVRPAASNRSSAVVRPTVAGVTPAANINRSATVAPRSDDPQHIGINKLMAGNIAPIVTAHSGIPALRP